jgi:hypothetical protein
VPALGINFSEAWTKHVFNAEQLKALLKPPTTNTLPSLNSVAVWFVRAVAILPLAGVKVPATGVGEGAGGGPPETVLPESPHPESVKIREIKTISRAYERTN